MTLTQSVMVLDCHDPERLAVFWCDLLAWKVVFRVGPYVGISRSDDFDTTGWLFQRVAEPKNTKNRWHPDFRVSGDFYETVRRIESCGGKRVDGYEPGGFFVMADPEGNEFCLLPEGVELNMDENGNVDYLSRI